MNIGEILLFTVNSILPLILLIVLGYVLKLAGFFTKEFLKYANKTVFYVCLPVLLFKNVVDIEAVSMIRFDVVGYSLAVVAVLMLMGFFLTFTVTDPRQKGVLHQCIFRSNFALIGVPLSELIGGGDGVRIAAILSVFTIPIFNMVSVIVLSVYRGKGVKPDGKKIIKGIVTNPLIIGVFCGILVMLFRSTVIGGRASELIGRFSFINTTINYISRAATPLALIVLGGQFEFKKLSGYKKPLTIGLLGRNMVAPLLGVGVAGILKTMGLVDFGPEVFAALISLFGTPVAVASAVMAEAMDNDGGLAGQLVVWTSLVSMFSLFVIIAVCKTFGLL